MLNFLKVSQQRIMRNSTKSQIEGRKEGGERGRGRYAGEIKLISMGIKWNADKNK